MYRNLVLEGGGVKSISFIGAFRALEEVGIMKNIDRVCGCSGGSIGALLLSLGMTSQEIEHEWRKINHKLLKDDSPGILQDILRLFRRYGIYQGLYLKNFIGGVLERKGIPKDVKLRDFSRYSKRDLDIVVSNVSNGTTILASSYQENELSDVPLMTVIRMSTSIPIVYEAVRYKKMIYIDGGVYQNYPITAYDRSNQINKETIGLKSGYTQDEKMKGYRTNNLFRYGVSVVMSIYDQLQNIRLTSENWKRTIVINTEGVSAFDFNISSREIDYLIQRGYEDTLEAQLKIHRDF